MHLLPILAVLGAALLSPTTASAQPPSQPPSRSVTFRVPATHLLPNPYGLPPRTHATLSSFGGSFSAPLSTANAFVFHNVTAGSYLVDVHCPTHGFVPLRLDVAAPDHDGAPDARGKPLSLRAWETFRGNDWDNRGEAVAAVEDGVFDLRAFGAKNYFMERSKFSALTILKNPMILIGLVTMGVFVGMPYLLNNMDPDMRAEFEERQKSSTMNSLLSGPQPGANPMGGFDMAAYLSGSSKKDDGGAGGAGNGAGAASGGASGGGGSASGGGKKKK